MTGANGGARRGLLIGWHAEQALIADRLADREAGTAVLVRGPAGIGKTAFIDEAVRRTRPPQARVKIYPDSAHGFLFQHHAEFAADVDTFLGGPR